MSGSTGSRCDFEQIGGRARATFACDCIIMTLIGLRVQNCCCADFTCGRLTRIREPPFRARRLLPPDQRSPRSLFLEKIVLVGFRPGAWQCGWHAMVAGWSALLAVLAALSILIGNLVATGANQRSAASCLLCCRACRLHAAWTGRREPGRILSDTFLRGCLCRSRCSVRFGVVAVVRSETWWRRSKDFSGLAGLRRC
jgi:hypothetical protein